MINSFVLAALSVAAAVGPQGLSGALDFGAKAAETPTATDITTSSSWWDLCLLFAHGEPEGFNAFRDCVSESRRYPNFQYIAAKPFEDDVYLYFYFDNAGSSPMRYDDSGATPYFVTASISRKGTSGAVEWSSTGQKALTKVGNSYNVGTQYLVKFRMESALTGAMASSTFDLGLGDFGTEITLGPFSGYVPRYQIDSEQEFTYTDSQYDITSRLWGTESTTVSMIAESARPMTDKQFSGEECFLAVTHAYGGTVTELGSGYYENHFVFFDLDRTPDQILAVDFYYTMVEFYVEAKYEEYTYNYNWDPNVQGSTQSETFLDCPTGVDLSGANDEYSDFPIVKTAKTANCRALNTDGSTHTIDNVETDLSWAPPFHASYTRHIPQIIDNATIDASVGDKSTRDWLSTYAKKQDGSMYEYSVCFDSTKREWTDKKTKTEESSWLFLPLGWTQYRLARCHTAQGIVAGRMTVLVDGKQLNWNVFSQPVNEMPDAPADSHVFTLNEMLISLNKKNMAWVVALCMAAFSVVASLAVLGATALIAGSGAQTVRIDTSKKKGK